MNDIGHNSGDVIEVDMDPNDVNARIRSLVERIERLEQERKELGTDIKDIYSEGKSAGFDPKVMKRLISIRKQDPDDVEAQDELLHLYKTALGM